MHNSNATVHVIELEETLGEDQKIIVGVLRSLSCNYAFAHGKRTRGPLLLKVLHNGV